jgi:hypothetical protein
MTQYIHPSLNSFEVALVIEDLASKQIKDYRMLPGNNCIFVSFGMVSSYYIFRDGRIIDIQID